MSAAAYRRTHASNQRSAQRQRRHKHDLYESARMFNEAFDRTFCASRPHLRYLGAGAFDRAMQKQAHA